MTSKPESASARLASLMEADRPGAFQCVEQPGFEVLVCGAGKMPPLAPPLRETALTAAAILRDELLRVAHWHLHGRPTSRDDEVTSIRKALAAAADILEGVTNG